MIGRTSSSRVTTGTAVGIERCHLAKDDLTVKHLPFSKSGTFYKGNLHTHSTRSDGGIAPEEVISAYRHRGYDFISLTDHFLPESYFRSTADPASFITISDTTNLRSDDFTTLPGAEIHGPGMANGEMWHLVAVGLPLDFPIWTAPETGVDLARRAVEAGAFVGIAHPYWNSLSVDDARQVAGFVHSVEVYNHSCAGGIDRGDGYYMLDLLSQEGVRLSANAADDAHFRAETPDPLADDAWQFEAFGGWVQVRAASLDPDALLAALKDGEFYSSTGPEITNIEILGDEILVECSAASRILVTGNGALSRRVQGNDVKQATFPVGPFREHGWMRVTVIDANGKRAWSNPIWLDDDVA